MVGRNLRNYIAKAVIAASLAAAVLASALPEHIYAEPDRQNDQEGPGEGNPETGSGEYGNSDTTENVEALLKAGSYEEGCVLVLYDRFAGSVQENTVGSTENGNGTSLLSSAEVIDTVSGESYEAASREVLEPVDSEALVGASGNDGSPYLSDEERISILLVEDRLKSTRELLEEVLKDPAVLYAQPNYIYEPDDVTGSGGDSTVDSESPEESLGASDPEPQAADGEINSETAVGAISVPDLTGLQWQHNGDSLIPVTDVDKSSLYNVHAPYWNESGKTNAEGIVAILDGGVDYTHPDLKDVMYEFSPELQEKLNCGPYGINTSGQGNTLDPMDYKGHGTHCAGVVAASWNDMGVSGLTSGCKIMAVRIGHEDGSMSDLGIVKGMAFVADASDQGIDIRVTSNSYSSSLPTPLFSTEIEELEKRGIVCVYSSGNNDEGNDVSEVSLNGLMRASNTVIVNAATHSGTKALFSNYGEYTTDVYAPGAGILSTITTQNNLTANRFKTYFASLDPSAVYYNTAFDGMPYLPEPRYGITQIHADPVSDSFSYDADGKALKITLDVLDYETSMINFFVDIPVGDAEEISYVSMAIYIPGDQYAVSLKREGSGQDGSYLSEGSGLTHLEGSWAFLSCNGAADRIAQGGQFPVVRSEDDTQNCVRVELNISKGNGDFKDGDVIYIDQIGAGTNAEALLPYGCMDGTSMACPHVSAEAAVLYAGKERSKANAAEVVRQIKARVISNDTLNKCRSHGAVDLAVTPDLCVPVVENAVTDGSANTITVTGINFRDSGKIYLADEEMEVLNWSDTEIVFRCPENMRSGILGVRVRTSSGTGSAAFLLTAPDDAADSATPLYENDIPAVPDDLFPAGSVVGGAVGLNDHIYLLLHDELEYENTLANKMIRYSVADKSWEAVADLPKSLSGTSVAGYRGKVLVSGTYTDEDGDHETVFSYSPSSDKWEDLKLAVNNSSSLVNFKDSVYSIGGTAYNEQWGEITCTNEIMLLDIENGTMQKAGELESAIMGGFTATDADAIYLGGGRKYAYHSFRESVRLVQIIRVAEDGKLTVSSIEPLTSLETNYPRHDVIAGYQGVYMVGHAGTSVPEEDGDDEGTDGPGSYVDVQGLEVLDADTFILNGEDYSPYNKRFSRDIVSLVRPVEYKGELYAFGWSVYDGEKYMNFIGRSTKIGESNAPVWDSVKVEIPTAADGLVYNGKEQTGVPASEEGCYTVTGNTAKEAGTYYATLTLTDPDRYIWEDGTYEDKVITWKIAAPAEPTVTAIPTVTTIPTVTAIPTVTTIPTVTVTPAVTTSPAVTQTPKPTSTSVPKTTLTPTKKGKVASPTGKATGKAAGTTAKSSSGASTGDSSQPIFWFLMAGVSVTAIVVIFLKLRKK